MLERAIRARWVLLGVRTGSLCKHLAIPYQRLRGWIESENPQIATMRRISLLTAVPMSVLVGGDLQEIVGADMPEKETWYMDLDPAEFDQIAPEKGWCEPESP